METLDLTGQWTSDVFTMTLRSKKFLIIKTGKSEHKGIFHIEDDFITLSIFENDKFVQTIILKIKNRSHSELTATIISSPFNNQIVVFKRTYFDIDLIKLFDFDEDHEINISEVKKLLQIEKLSLNYATDKEGNKTELLHYWDNNNRFAVVIPKALVESIKENSDLLLSIYGEIRLANLGYYTNFKIEKYIKPRETYYEREISRSYSKYNGAFGYDDETIDSAFEGDPSNIWNID
jgi:hypothetical protein